MDNSFIKSSWKRQLLDTSDSCFLCYKHTKSNNSFLSLKHLCLLLNLNATEIFKVNDKVSEGDKLDVTISTCDSCAKIIAKLSALYESLEVIKMEIDYYLKCFKLVGKGAQEDAKLMEGFRQRQFSCESGYLLHIPIYHRLRSTILEKCSKEFAPQPEIKLKRLSPPTLDAKAEVEAKVEVVWQLSHEDTATEEKCVGVNPDHILTTDPLATEMDGDPPNHETPVINLINNGRPHTCQICGKEFKKKDAVRVHMRVHTGSKPFSCKICANTFRQRSHVYQHLSIYHNIENYLKARYIIYHQEKEGVSVPVQMPFQAPNSAALEPETIYSEQVKSPEPQAIQEDPVQKEWSCGMCGKGFSRKDYLSEHARIHTGERPYECTICGQKFFRRGMFWEHKTKHQYPDGKPYKCSVCGNKFTRKIYLIKHFRTHTSQRLYSEYDASKNLNEQIV